MKNKYFLKIFLFGFISGVFFLSLNPLVFAKDKDQDRYTLDIYKVIDNRNTAISRETENFLDIPYPNIGEGWRTGLQYLPEQGTMIKFLLGQDYLSKVISRNSDDACLGSHGNIKGLNKDKECKFAEVETQVFSAQVQKKLYTGGYFILRLDYTNITKGEFISEESTIIAHTGDGFPDSSECFELRTLGIGGDVHCYVSKSAIIQRATTQTIGLYLRQELGALFLQLGYAAGNTNAEINTTTRRILTYATSAPEALYEPSDKKSETIKVVSESTGTMEMLIGITF